MCITVLFGSGKALIGHGGTNNSRKPRWFTCFKREMNKRIAVCIATDIANEEITAFLGAGFLFVVGVFFYLFMYFFIFMTVAYVTVKQLYLL